MPNEKLKVAQRHGPFNNVTHSVHKCYRLARKQAIMRYTKVVARRDLKEYSFVVAKLILRIIPVKRCPHLSFAS